MDKKTVRTIMIPHNSIKTVDALLKAIFYRENAGFRYRNAMKVIKLLKAQKEATVKQVFEGLKEKEYYLMYETLATLKALGMIKKEGKVYKFSRRFYDKLKYIMDTMIDEGLVPIK